MKRGFHLLIGSLVALAIAADVGAQLDSGYNDGRKEFQYLPGGAEGSEGRTSPLRSRNGRRLKGGRIHNVPRADPPVLPGEFAGEYDGDAGAVPGEPGVDYPTFSFIPVTSFSCEGRIAGYYADPETGCQTFHVCTPGGSPSNSFICPNGTLFNADIRTCDWWPAVDCGSSSESLKITNDFTKVKSKSETPQVQHRVPDTRVKPQRKTNRGQLQKLRLNPANEVLPQVTYRTTATPSIVTEGSQYQPFVYTEAPLIQTPQTTSRVQQFTQDASQNNNVENYKEQEYTRRRPSGSKRIRNRLPKRPEEANSNVPSRISQYKFGESYRTNPSTIRTTSPTPQVSYSTRSQPITRFDFTSETLNFPSVRNAPSTTTYPTPTAYKNANNKRFKQRFTTVSPITAPETENYRASFSIEDENKASTEYTSTTTSSYTGRKQFKASKRVNLSPIITSGPTNSQPQSVKTTSLNNQRASSFGAQNYRQPPFFRATQEPTQASVEYTKTTPRDDSIFSVSGTSEKIFNNLVTPTIPTLAENEGGIRPIVVASPKPDFNSLRSSAQKKSSPSGFLKVTPPAESFQPISSSSAQSFSQSQSLANNNNPDDKKQLPVSVAGSQAQSIAYSQTDSSDTKVQTPSVSQAFAKASALSVNLDQSSVGQSTPLTTDKTQPDEQAPFDIIHTRSSPQPRLSPSGGLNQASRIALPNFSQSFASADAFSSGEGFGQNFPITTTNSPTSAPKTTTFKPLRPLVSQTTSRPSTTTIRVPYTPTVPQTTARTTTTTSTPKTTVPTTTTTRKPPRDYPKPVTSTPAVISTSTPSIGYPPSKSVKVSSTTKSPKGFYITVSPPTTAAPVQQKFSKDKVPIENSLPKPSSTYLPNSQQYPVKSYSPNFYYQPSRPSIPDSYFRIPPSTGSLSYNQYSSTGSVNSHSETKPTPEAPQNSGVLTPQKEVTFNNPPSQTKSTAATVLSTGSGLNTAEYPISDPTFEIKAVPDTFNGSGFELNPLATVEYNPQYFPDYNLPSQKNEDHQSDKNLNFSAPEQVDRTTEPSFVIQKSLELFSAHEVAYHPSVFAQTSYSLSTIQDDYLRGSNQETAFKPPPFLQPSPNARGFGIWNKDDDQKGSQFIIS